MAVRAQKVTEKGSRYIDFLIPGLLGMNLMGTGIWSLAFSVTTRAAGGSSSGWWRRRCTAATICWRRSSAG